MASVFRIRTHVDKSGKRCSKATPGARLKLSDDWYGSYLGADGLWHKKNFGSDKAEALRQANHLENEARLRLNGLVDPRADAYKQAEITPIAEHIAAYERNLLDEGGSPAYAALTALRVRETVTRAKIDSISELKPSTVAKVISDLKSSGVLAARTCSHYQRAIKQFSRWLLKEGRAREDALVGLKVRVAISREERAYVRRALSREEFDTLMTYTEQAGISYKMTGADRAWFYRLAAVTGFRSAEVRSLAPAAFSLTNPEAGSVTVKAGYSKRGKRSGRDDIQPLPVGVVDALTQWLANKPKTGILFPVGKWDVADMLRKDCRIARARWIRETADPRERRKRRESTYLAMPTPSGEVIDYHSFRASYCTWLAMSGAPLKVVQSLARHSTPVLTLNTYVAPPSLADSGRALDSLPTTAKPAKPEAQKQVLRATGTDGSKPELHMEQGKYRWKLGGKRTGKSGHSLAIAGASDENPASAENTQIKRENEQKPREIKKADGGSRTRNLRFTKPLLCH